MTTTEKAFKLLAPVGSIVTFKESMTEKEIREFTLQILSNQADEEMDVWEEKIKKDPIESVIEYLRSAGYIVEQI